MEASLKSLTASKALTNVLRLVGILVCIAIVWRQSKISIFPIRLADVIVIGPLAVATFCKQSSHLFWFLWGIAIGGLLVALSTPGFVIHP